MTMMLAAVLALRGICQFTSLTTVAFIINHADRLTREQTKAGNVLNSIAAYCQHVGRQGETPTLIVASRTRRHKTRTNERACFDTD